MTDEQLFADVPHPADAPPPVDTGDGDIIEVAQFALPDAAEPGRPGGPSPFTEGLNPDQLDAVVHADGPLLVVAGAGSGKTRVLTHRIAHLVHEGVQPSKVLAITFTNKAAREMRERVFDLIGPVVKAMWVSTFHSACVRILRLHGEAIGYPRQFSIYDAADANRLTSYVIRDLGLDSKRFTPRSVHAVISLKKNELVSPSQMADEAKNIFDRKHADIYAEYQARLEKAGAMDFDDLLVNVVRLFREHPQVLEHYRERFEHILIDEYQDTNQAQNQIALLLAGGREQICVVGDSDQCLPPDAMIVTPEGMRPIEQIQIGDRVLGASGNPELHAGTVSFVKEGSFDGHLIEISVGAHRLRVTPHHLIPTRLVARPGRYLVYLMYRADRGYRVGRTTGAMLTSHEEQPCHELFGALQQEHADAIWLLKTCDSLAEAAYFESMLAAEYGLPTAHFHSFGHGLAMDDKWLASLFRSIDTATRAKKLLDDRLLLREFPHHRPQHGARLSTIDLTMFCDRRTSIGHHQVHWSTNRPELIERLERGGVSLRSSDHRLRSYETLWKSYRQALDDAKRVAVIGGLDIRRRLAHDGVTYDLMPASHLHPGMEVLVECDGAWVPQAIDSVEFVPYAGPVYDLEVDATHSYGAEGLLVHNSVYKFRGADFRNIVQFEDAFETVTTIVLDQNYRSTQNILDAANSVIDYNVERTPKALWTDSGRGEPITRYHAEDEGDEATFIASTARRLQLEQGTRWRDMAVLYRTNAQSRVLEDAFMRIGVPYQVIGGTRFYDRREVKDAVAYLRAGVNPADEVSVKRVLNVPKRGVGDASVDKLDAFAATESITFVEALRRSDEAGVSGKAARGIGAFIEVLDGVATMAADDQFGPGDVIQGALEASGYLAELEAEDTVEAHTRIENLGELVGSAREFTRIDEFMEQVALVADTDELPDSAEADDQVVLMTLHSAKGLEFPVVFLVGVEEGVFPHIRSLTDPDEMEEERRLAYVGITRAMEKLYLTHAWSRQLFGSTQYNPPSRFFDEIPGELIQSEGNVTGRSSYGRQSYRSQRDERGYDSGYHAGGGHRSGSWRARAGSSWSSDDVPEFRPRSERFQGRSDGDELPGRDINADLHDDEHQERVVDAAVRAGQKLGPTNSQEQGFEVGDQVDHPAFGAGTIIALEGEGDKAEAVINFAGVGLKHLSLAWAPLTKH